MTTVAAILAFVQGTEAFRRRAAARLPGSPFMLRLTYLSGHPGMYQSEPVWAGRVGDRLRLVDQRGERHYDLPLDRISTVSYGSGGQVQIGFEPTAGLQTTVAFAAEEGAYGRLLQLTATEA